MGIFPVEFPTTTADSFESFRVLHYLAFIKEEDVLIETGYSPRRTQRTQRGILFISVLK